MGGGQFSTVRDLVALGYQSTMLERRFLFGVAEGFAKVNATSAGCAVIQGFEPDDFARSPGAS